MPGRQSKNHRPNLFEEAASDSQRFAQVMLFSRWAQDVAKLRTFGDSLLMADLGAMADTGAPVCSSLYQHFNDKGIPTLEVSALGEAATILQRWAAGERIETEALDDLATKSRTQYAVFADYLRSLQKQGQADEHLYGAPVFITTVGNVARTMEQIKEWQDRDVVVPDLLRQRVAVYLSGKIASPGKKKKPAAMRAGSASPS